jgi:hypothetical protein
MTSCHRRKPSAFRNLKRRGPSCTPRGTQLPCGYKSICVGRPATAVGRELVPRYVAAEVPPRTIAKKFLCILVPILLKTSLASSEPLIQTGDGQALLKWVEAALAVNDIRSPEVDAAALDAQTRIAAMGTRADDMLAQMALEAVETMPSSGVGPSLSVDGNLYPQTLLNLVSYDPAQTNKLLGPLAAWMDSAAAGKYPNAPLFAGNATFYINRWGGPEEKARIKQDIEEMLKSPDFSIRDVGKSAQRGLDGDSAVLIGYSTTISRHCQNAIAFRKKLAAMVAADLAAPPPSAKVIGTESKTDQSKPTLAQTPPPASPSPSTGRGWLIWLLVVVAAAGGMLWFAIRKRERQT